MQSEIMRSKKALTVSCASCLLLVFSLALLLYYLLFFLLFFFLAAADWARGAAANLPSYIAISAIIAPRKL